MSALTLAEDAPAQIPAPEITSLAWKTFGITSLAVFMVSLDATVVVAAFPAFRHAFGGAPDSLLSWVLNAYTIVYAALLVPAGRRADARGRRRAFLTGTILFTASSALCGWAPGIGWLIGARALQAVGAAILTPATFSLTLEAFPREKRALAVSLWSAFGALAAAFGPAVGSWLIDLASWPAIFLINLPIGIFAWWLGKTRLAELPDIRAEGRPDFLGSLLLIAGVASICLGIVRAPDGGEASAGAVAAILGGLLLLAVFIAWARRQGEAALGLASFEQRDLVVANAATFVFGASFSAMFLSFFLFMTGIWHYAQSFAGLAAMPGPLVVVPFAILAGRLAPRWGQRPVLILGGLLYAAGNLWYRFHVGTVPNYLGAWLPGQLVTGASIGLVLPSLTAAAVSGLPAARFGVGSAVNSAIRQLGGAVGIAVSVAIIAHRGVSLAAFRQIYFLLILGGLTTALLACALTAQSGTVRKSRRNP